MIIKKILLLLCFITCNQNLTASNHDKISEFYHKASLELALRKKHGAQIADINEIQQRKNLLLEIHDADSQDNTAELLTHVKATIFARHLAHHFGQEPVLEFVKIVECHAPETIALVENHFQQAVDNYFQSRQNPKVTPQGKTLIGYLTFLRDQNDE